MPFTLAHPAVVLPLAKIPKHRISLTGLVAGSMAPDFEYVFRLETLGEFGHSIPGLFYFDLPVGIGLSLLFHMLVRVSLIDSLPLILKARVWSYRNTEWRFYPLRYIPALILGVLIGACSHVLWDSFTHSNGYFVNHLPVLKETVEIAGTTMSKNRILQHGSTLIGGLSIGMFLIMLRPDYSVKGNMNWFYWCFVGVFSLLAGAVRNYIALDYREFGNVVAVALAGFFYSIILISTFYLIRRKTGKT